MLRTVVGESGEEGSARAKFGTCVKRESPCESQRAPTFGADCCRICFRPVNPDRERAECRCGGGAREVRAVGKGFGEVRRHAEQKDAGCTSSSEREMGHASPESGELSRALRVLEAAETDGGRSE